MGNSTAAGAGTGPGRLVHQIHTIPDVMAISARIMYMMEMPWRFLGRVRVLVPDLL